MARVWRHEKTGTLFHDQCFDEDETRDGYAPVTLDELEDDDECGSCSVVFLSGLGSVDEPNGNGDDEE